MKLQIKILTENPEERALLLNYYSNKSRANHTTDSGLDLLCHRRMVIMPGETTKIPLGIACQVVESSHPHGYYLYPRSSIIKTPMRLANSVGIIDYDYRGEITAVVDYYRGNHTFTCDYHNREGFIVEPGTRYFQLCSPSLAPIEFEIVDELSDTARGAGGFGSSGGHSH
jgi:dUTP pyrophosphatase